MSIATAITNAQQKVANAYTAVSGKGGTLPSTQNLSNLPTAISSIPTGSTPVISSLNVTPTTSAQTITAPSGTDGYSPINVSAVTSAIDNNITAGNIKSGVSILGVTGTYTGGGGTGIPREVNSIGVYQMPTSSFTFSLPNTAINVGNYALYYAFYNSGLTSVDLSSLTTVSGTSALQNAFYGCTGLTSIDLSSLTTISGNYALQYAFQGAGLTSVDLSSLTTVSGISALQYAFRDCTSLTSVDLSSLTTISGSSALEYAFRSCTSLPSIDLSSLTTIGNSGSALRYAFYGCTGLTSVDLSSLTTISGSSALEYAFNGCTGLTSVALSSLKTIGVNSSSNNGSHFRLAFSNCRQIEELRFPSLEEIYCTGSSAVYGTFSSNNYIQKMYFPKLDTITYGTGASSSNQNACKNIFYDCSALTELHFSAANQSAIQASSGYSTAWGRGAGNVTIYFDL